MRSLSLYEVSKEIYRIFNLYYRLHGVRITLFTALGEKLYPQEDQPDCSYCRLVRKNLEKDQLCRKLDQKMIDLSLRENRMLSYRCHGGMQEAAMPLMVDGEAMGCIMLGQFRKDCTDNEGRLMHDHSPYLEEWSRRFHNKQLEQAYMDTPVYMEDKVPVLLELYQVIMDFISREKMIRHRDFDLIRPLLHLLEENPARHLTLTEVSDMIGRSPSAVSRLFRNITGKSFQQWLIDYKMEKAQEMMLEKKHRRLSEIAWELGYRDALYFSRLFKKHRGLSPSDWKKQKLNG